MSWLDVKNSKRDGERAYVKIVWKDGGKVKVMKQDEERIQTHTHNLLWLYFYLHVLIPMTEQIAMHKTK